MGIVRTHLLFLPLLVLFSGAATDDSATMSRLLAAISPTPLGWSSGECYCDWSGVNCDSSLRVTSIDVSSSSLHGTLPDLSSLTRLRALSLQKNSFSGPIPNLANLASLEKVYLDFNNFTAMPSGAFQGLTSLQILSLSENCDIQPWAIPTVLSDSASLISLYAVNAGIVGSLPDFLGSLPSLQNLTLSYNNLTGPLPSSLGGSWIQTLWIDNQAMGLSGDINVLSSMTHLSQVWLQNNQFTGPIPDLSKCVALFDIQLRDNQFTGLVPASLLALPSLQNVALDNNKLQGPVPDNSRGVTLTYGGTNVFCNAHAGPCNSEVTTLLEVAGALNYPLTLANSWSGNDACNGWSFVACQGNNVTSVNFSKQGFSGTISPAFTNLTSLQILLLNDNDLTGYIPQSLSTLSQLQVLDVSNNNLSGSIPAFPATVKLTYLGNPLLGKTSGSGSGEAPGNGTGPSSGSSGASTASLVLPDVIVGIVVSVVIISLLVMLYRCFCGRNRQSSKVGTPAIGMEARTGDHNDLLGYRVASIEELQEATNNFSDDNKIGEGGFAVVFKGEWRGETVAIKRMKSVEGRKQFEAEINALTKARHRHVVALLGSCIDGNDCLLVYEYVPQGTLAEHLFKRQENGRAPLELAQRLTIGLDVARGVEYLHNLAPAPDHFIHRDLKPSNILLDEEMRAKVADFGLVKNAPDGNGSVTTSLAGTFGYLAPECLETGKVSKKVDVYAYGVILMELITGRQALDSSKGNLINEFRELFQDKKNIRDDIRPHIDEALLPAEGDELSRIIKVAELAVNCAAREPEHRPDMGYIVGELRTLVEPWKPSNRTEEKSPSVDLRKVFRQLVQGSPKGHASSTNDAAPSHFSENTQSIS